MINQNNNFEKNDNDELKNVSIEFNSISNVEKQIITFKEEIKKKDY